MIYGNGVIQFQARYSPSHQYPYNYYINISFFTLRDQRSDVPWMIGVRSSEAPYIAQDDGGVQHNSLFPVWS